MSSLTAVHYVLASVGSLGVLGAIVGVVFLNVHARHIFRESKSGAVTQILMPWQAFRRKNLSQTGLEHRTRFLWWLSWTFLCGVVCGLPFVAIYLFKAAKGL